MENPRQFESIELNITGMNSQGEGKAVLIF
jgi:hypothetical protein